MKPPDAIKRLTIEIDNRHRNGAEPFLLILGRGCAEAANIPSEAMMARHLIRTLALVDRKRALRCVDEEQLEQVVAGEPGDEDALSQAFYRLMDVLRRSDRDSALQDFYANVPVPTFYLDIATLIKTGYFKHVLTTSIDTLLEQALNAVNLSQGHHYDVITPHDDAHPKPRQKARATRDVLHVIFKLHGDLSDPGFNVSADEVDHLLGPDHAHFRNHRTEKVLIIGYEMESEPLNEWLVRSNKDIWWISPEPPFGNAWFQHMNVEHIVDGEAGRADQAFTQLALLLLRQPVLQSFASAKASAEPPSSRNAPTLELHEDAAIEEDFVREQLRRNQMVLRYVEQSPSVASSFAPREAQIEYQRQQLMQIQSELFQLDQTRDRLRQLIDQAEQLIEQKGAAGETSAYLRQQFLTIRSQIERHEPNAHVLSAAISATVVLCERLGSNLVSQELVHELASYVPGLGTRAL